MFYYLGRKKRLAGLYPEPEFDTIIEPFAGSAAYSLHGDRWEKQVVLNDLSPVTMLVWRYLMEASVADILKLPEFKQGDRISDVKWLSEAERWLIAFHINPGSNQRTDVCTKFSRWPAGRRYIIKNLHKIKHWKLYESEYFAIENVEATWFVDPPYQGIPHYMTNTVDHATLGRWCEERNGQVIVCEKQGADWLPFESLASIDICGPLKSQEAVWTKRGDGLVVPAAAEEEIA